MPKRDSVLLQTTALVKRPCAMASIGDSPSGSDSNRLPNLLGESQWEALAIAADISLLNTRVVAEIDDLTA